MIVYLGNLNWRSAGTVGNKTIHIFENDTGPDDANHAENGIFVFKTDPASLSKAGVSPGQMVEDLSLYDIAPTILDHFGLPIPPDMIGKSILKGKAEDIPGMVCDKEPQVQGEDYSEDEEEKIRKHLEDLGYL